MVLMRVKARYPLSKKERRTLAKNLESLGRWAEELLSSAGKVELARALIGGTEVVAYIFDGLPLIIEAKDGILEPCLYGLIRGRLGQGLPRVIVDRGAASAVARGARLMIPGIRSVEGDFGEGAIVLVVDEDSGVPVAVGRALMSSEEMKRLVESKGRGAAVKPSQRPGDPYWRLCEQLA